MSCTMAVGLASDSCFRLRCKRHLFYDESIDDFIQPMSKLKYMEFVRNAMAMLLSRYSSTRDLCYQMWVTKPSAGTRHG